MSILNIRNNEISWDLHVFLIRWPEPVHKQLSNIFQIAFSCFQCVRIAIFSQAVFRKNPDPSKSGRLLLSPEAIGFFPRKYGSNMGLRDSTATCKPAISIGRTGYPIRTVIIHHQQSRPSCSSQNVPWTQVRTLCFDFRPATAIVSSLRLTASLRAVSGFFHDLPEPLTVCTEPRGCFKLEQQVLQSLATSVD